MRFESVYEIFLNFVVSGSGEFKGVRVGGGGGGGGISHLIYAPPTPLPPYPPPQSTVHNSTCVGIQNTAKHMPYTVQEIEYWIGRRGCKGMRRKVATEMSREGVKKTTGGVNRNLRNEKKN